MNQYPAIHFQRKANYFISIIFVLYFLKHSQDVQLCSMDQILAKLEIPLTYFEISL
jgi:hypothetical protein